MATARTITACLWFDSEAEQAARFYVSLFADGRIGRISRYGKEGVEVHGRPDGSVMTVEFEIAGRSFTALNGGPRFKFTEAVSFQIPCETQDEIDRYWSALSSGGEAGPCGWLKDRYGLSWQIYPAALPDIMCDPDPAKAARVMRYVMGTTKFDIAALRAAYEGKSGDSRA
jgi:predicted 3-demethylubiquinone-9 3-methyltransferase (glyoxalase superfamily)